MTLTSQMRRHCSKTNRSGYLPLAETHRIFPTTTRLVSTRNLRCKSRSSTHSSASRANPRFRTIRRRTSRLIYSPWSLRMMKVLRWRPASNLQRLSLNKRLRPSDQPTQLRTRAPIRARITAVHNALSPLPNFRSTREKVIDRCHPTVVQYHRAWLYGTRRPVPIAVTASIHRPASLATRSSLGLTT